MTTETYTNRRIEPFTVKDLHEGEHSLGVTTTEHSGFGVPLNDETRQIIVGGTYELEMKGFNTIGGVLDNGRYLFRHSDQHFERQHAEFLADHARRKRELLEANRDDWQARQDALSGWLKERMERFHTNGGEYFALEGWGYELTICELAAIYERNGQIDDEEIDEFGRQHGTSGNQHECAKALVRWKDSPQRVMAGLAPLTGDPDYSKGP